MLQLGMQQNLLATDDAFAFVRTEDLGGCSPDRARERVLVVMNKAQQSRPVELTVDITALAGCTEFDPMAPRQAFLQRLMEESFGSMRTRSQ